MREHQWKKWFLATLVAAFITTLGWYASARGAARLDEQRADLEGRIAILESRPEYPALDSALDHLAELAYQTFAGPDAARASAALTEGISDLQQLQVEIITSQARPRMNEHLAAAQEPVPDALEERAPEPFRRGDRMYLFVTADTWTGGEWPFTFGQGWISYEKQPSAFDIERGAVFMTDHPDGRMWPLNGTAMNVAARYGAEPRSDPIRRELEYGALANTMPVIQRGLELCAIMR